MCLGKASGQRRIVKRAAVTAAAAAAQRQWPNLFHLMSKQLQLSMEIQKRMIVVVVVVVFGSACISFQTTAMHFKVAYRCLLQICKQTHSDVCPAAGQTQNSRSTQKPTVKIK